MMRRFRSVRSSSSRARRSVGSCFAPQGDNTTAVTAGTNQSVAEPQQYLWRPLLAAPRKHALNLTLLFIVLQSPIPRISKHLCDFLTSYNPRFFIVCVHDRLLYLCRRGCSTTIQAALLKGVDVRDMRRRECCLSLLARSRRYSQKNFRKFIVLLRRNGWDVDHPLLGFGPWRCDWALSKGSKDQ